MSVELDIISLIEKLSVKVKGIQIKNNNLEEKVKSIVKKLDKAYLILNGGSLPNQKIKLARDAIEELIEELKEK